MAWPASGPTTLPGSFDPGRYVFGERIGVSGDVEVLRGELRGADGFVRPVVFHRLSMRAANDTARMRAFVDRARLAARLTHANIVQVIDCARDGQGPFAVLEAVDGPDLATLLARLRRRGVPHLTIPLAVGIAAAVLKALDYAHRATDAAGQPLAFAHGDVRPATVRLSRDGQVKLAVFDASVGRGERSHRSPEQQAGLAADARTDVRAVGALLYELLTGAAPSPDRPAPPSVVAAEVPRELDRAVLRALDPDRENRFPDTESCLQALLAASVPRFGTSSARDVAALVERAIAPALGDGEWSLGETPVPDLEPAWAGGDPLAAAAVSPSARIAARRSLLVMLLFGMLAVSGAAAGAAWYLRLF
jgi:serine/threonine-protein kinase